jgi:signal transduction histidine kinase
MSNLQFKVSSALKDVIGRDLITDDYIAIFELVKNSYDASATRVDVIFENIYNNKDAKIIIKDDGKGMNFKDIQDKWLFVAYSAKRDGTEDDDYREKIYSNKPFAGYKGIGRFSCDRLGKILKLEGTRKGNRTEILLTDWGEFEKDMKAEFIEINIKHSSKEKNSYGLKHGVALEISELRSTWDDKKIFRLRDSLSKLINPSGPEKGKDFNIYLTCEDLGLKEEKIENFIFETLEIKTTKIQIEIPKEGDKIITELRDGGTLIYRIEEKNIYSPFLFFINVTAYYLNRSAKQTFKSRMGVNTKDYGSIFLYKNNIRIYPYGEPGEDPLKLDQRKAQKPTIYIGNKDVIGRIEIIGSNAGFNETSSRGDGFIRNDTYNSFLSFFMDKVIERLEKYVIDVQKWGDGSFLSIEDELDNNNENEIKTKIIELISKLTNSEEITEVQYDDDFLNVLTDRQSDSAITLVKNLFRLAKESGNEKLLDVASRTEKRVSQLINAYRETKADAEKSSKELEQIISENLFLKSIKSQDFDEIVSLMHSIGISASTIDNYLSSAYLRINKGQQISQSELEETIKIISFENRKILSISRFATKANFKLYSEETRGNIVAYISEYLNNVVKPLRKESINIMIENDQNIRYDCNFRPIDMSILLDNLISNSIRAHSKKFILNISTSPDEKLIVIVSDDGKGIPKENIEKVFNFGFTTTSGSGLGLYHIKKILEKMNAEIKVNNNPNMGTEFIIKF